MKRFWQSLAVGCLIGTLFAMGCTDSLVGVDQEEIAESVPGLSPAMPEKTVEQHMADIGAWADDFDLGGSLSSAEKAQMEAFIMEEAGELLKSLLKQLKPFKEAMDEEGDVDEKVQRL